MYNAGMQRAAPPELPFDLPRERGPYRLADYLALPDGPRCEIFRGHLVVTPAPQYLHQRVIGVLYEVLVHYARRAGGVAVLSPADVVLGEDTIVQPDVFFLKEESLSKADKWITGAPDLVVEVVSPGQARRDRMHKQKLYLEAGVPEYWIVDGDERTIDFLVNRDGRFELESPDEESYRSPTLPCFEMHLARFWRAVDDPRAEP